MKGNILIRGATMTLPTQTVLGDLRVRDGIIHSIAVEGTLEPLEDELFIDAEGLHLYAGND